MSLIEGRLRNALDETQDGYKKLLDDIIEGKLSLKEIREKHVGMFEAIGEVTEKLLELPQADIVIEVCNGVVQDVYVSEKDGPISYVVFDPDMVFDPYELSEAKPYKDYETVLDDLRDSYITEEEIAG